MSSHDTPIASISEAPSAAEPDSFEALAEALWSASVKAALKKANEDPYVETQDCYISGRDGIGSEKVAQIFTSPLYDATDEWHESSLDYTARERDEACEQAIEDALRDPSARALIASAAERWDEDEDELQERLVDELQERARDEGLDLLYDVAFELRGSVEASWQESLYLPCDDHADAYLPTFNETGSDWAKLLVWLNIEPHAFFNLCRDKAKEELARLRQETPAQEWADCEEAQIIRAWLKDQGLGRACPKTPARWPAELWEALRPAALDAWSYPKGEPGCSIEELYEALARNKNHNPEISMELSLSADDLTESSLLIDRFGEGGPILAASELAKTQKASAHELLIDGESVSLRQPVIIRAEDARFTDNSGDSGSLFPSARELRSEASQMEAATRSPGGFYLAQAQDEDFAAELQRGAELARAYGQKASAEGLAAAEARIQALAERSDSSSQLARERSELYGSVLLAQLHQGASKAPASAEPAQKAAKKAHELLELTPFGARQSAWRLEASRVISAAQAKGQLDLTDEFGNTLLRKAILAVDADLCEELLKLGADPMAKNAAGSLAWSAISRLTIKDQIKFAERLAPFGVARWRDHEGKTLMHRTHSAELAIALARLGADPSALDQGGVRADARIYSEKSKAEVEQAFLESALSPAQPRAKASLAL